MDHFFTLALGGLVAGAMNALAGGGSRLAAGNDRGRHPLGSSECVGDSGFVSGASDKRLDLLGRHATGLRRAGGASSGREQRRRPNRQFAASIHSIAAFDFILPWLMLTATLALALGRQAGVLLRRYVHIGPSLLLA